jgi:hypothetical protein
MSLPECERPSDTPIQNNRQNYSSVCFDLDIFLVADWQTKDAAPNDSKHSLTSICFSFFYEWNFDLLWLFVDKTAVTCKT